MAYKDSTTGQEFSTKKELIEYMIEKNSPFLEGDWAPLCKRLIEEKLNKETDAGKKQKYKTMLDNYEYI